MTTDTGTRPAAPALPGPTAALVRRTLDAWFADPGDDRLDLPRSKRWFGGGDELDAALREGFSDAVDAAARGEHDAALGHADGALALVVLLDQFPRNVYRGRARAFAYADRALATARLALARGHDTRLPIVGRTFLALPFGHDESMTSQARALALLEDVARSAHAARESAQDETGAASAIAEFADGALDSAREHARIIERFGRYPHRNAVLDRASTPEEREWLTGGSKRFGQ